MQAEADVRTSCWLYFRGSVDGRRRSKLRPSHSNTENPLLARHKRDTSSTCDQRHSMTMTPSDADRLYSCTADSAESWSRSLCHDGGPFGFSAASAGLVFPDCADTGPWLSADANCLYDRGGNVNVLPSNCLLASTLHVRSKNDASLSSTLPQPSSHTQV